MLLRGTALRRRSAYIFITKSCGGGSSMKRIVIGMAAAMSLFATGAMAVDLAAKPYVKAPVMVEPVWSWTGFYIGANAGYSWGRSRSDVTYTNTATGAVIAPPAGSITSASFEMNGAVAGGQAATTGRAPTGCSASRATFSGRMRRAAPSSTAAASRLPVVPAFRPDLPSCWRRNRHHGDDRPEAAVVRHRARPRRHPGDSEGAVLRHRRRGLRRDQERAR